MRTLLAENYAPIYNNFESNENASTDPIVRDHVALDFSVPQTTDSLINWKAKWINTLSDAVNETHVKETRVALKTDIDGAVIKIVEQSVTCELYTQPVSRFVQLPKALFPTDEISIGLPINLSIDQTGGIRKPVVVVRKVDSKILNEGAEIFDNIIF